MDQYTEVDRKLMKRCLHLAMHGSYHVGANPLVGAVISHDDRIIGEGYHKIYGGPHAEIEALRSVAREDRHLLKKSQLYVSLEPCNHHGKTPPCTDAIIEAGIPALTICNIDPNPRMSGISINKLKTHGVKIRHGLLENEGKEVNKKYFVNQSQGLPFIILKWAQSKDGFIGKKDQQVWLSNDQSKLQVHRWREEVDAIIVGTQTVIIDNPQLTNRRLHGRSPLRIILDRTGRIPKTAKVLSDAIPSIIFTTQNPYTNLIQNKKIYTMDPADWELHSILRILFQHKVSSIMIEGGALLLRSFIKLNLWHEARIIHSGISVNNGIRAPLLSGKIKEKFCLDQDKILIINNLKMNRDNI